MINPSVLPSYIDFWKARTHLESDRSEIKNLLQYKFTNPYRIQDRGSQVTYQQVMLNPSLSQNAEEVLFRLFVHLHFNTEKFATKVIKYELTLANYNCNDFNAYLQQDKVKLFSGAYMTLPLNGDNDRVYSMCRKAGFFAERFKAGSIDLKSADGLFASLKQLPGMGDFLSSQVVYDFEWFDEGFFKSPLYVLGCGAVRGAWKLGLNPNNPKTVLDTLKGVWEENLTDCYLGSYPPAPADLQNTLCETDKAFRMLHPEITKNGFPKAKLKPYKSRGGIHSFDKTYPPFWSV